MYDNGQGVAADHKVAAGWYLRAAEQANADAQFNLANMYEAGRGLDQDIVRAHMWFSIAAATVTGTMLWADLGAVTARERVAAKMTPAQVDEARALARKCIESRYWECR
jgi:hypothetical protein